jgi:tetratricopeptide (TPR) repeat protein
VSDESQPDAEAWGQQDWAAEETRPKVLPKRGRLGFAIAAVVGLVLLVGMFLWMQSAETARHQAEMEYQMALEMQMLAERDAAAKEAAEMDAKMRAAHPEPALDPVEAMRLMARDPEALNNTGMFLLNQMDEPEEAIEKLQEAAKLDPKYAANLELARKRKVQKDRTAPAPRSVEP